MTADLTEHEGKHLVATSSIHGHPWHRLGVMVDSYMGVDEALELVGVDGEHVIAKTLYTIDENNQLEEVEGYQGVYSNVFGNIAVSSPSYTITQRREIVEFGYEIVGLDPDNCHIDTVGNLGPRADTFFVYIRVPDIVIDEGGIADRIENGLFAATSFNGTLPNTVGWSPIRPVCRNTVNMALGKLDQKISVKHTRFAEQRMREAANVLHYVGMVEKAMIKQAEQMLKVNGDDALRKVCEEIWPLRDDLPEKTHTRRSNERKMIRGLYEGAGNLNVELVGRNGWAAFNAVVEYLDHSKTVRSNGRGDDFRGQQLARGAVLPGPTMNTKLRASEIILNMA